MLQDLTGLEGLHATAGITIGDNGALGSLAGIDHLMQGTTSLVEIANNPLLPTAAAQAFAEKVDDDGEGILVCGNMDGEPCTWIIGPTAGRNADIDCLLFTTTVYKPLRLIFGNPTIERCQPPKARDPTRLINEQGNVFQGRYHIQQFTGILDAS